MSSYSSQRVRPKKPYAVTWTDKQGHACSLVFRTAAQRDRFVREDLPGYGATDITVKDL